MTLGRCVALLAGIPCLAWCSFVSVPVTRVPLPRQQRALTSGGRLRGGHGATSQDVPLHVALSMNLGLTYQGTISVGTPGQQLTVIFDTSRPDLWVRGGGPQPFGPGRAAFDAGKSSTFSAVPGGFHYSSGSMSGMSGTYCSDRVDIGALRLDNFTFEEVTGGNFSGMSFDGALGLGFGGPSAADGVPILNALVAAGQLEQPAFGFYLGDNQTSELVLGGHNPAHVTTPFHFVGIRSIASVATWSVAVEGISAGDFALPTSSKLKLALFAPAVPMIGGPAEEVAALAAHLGAQKLPGHEVYSVDCSAEVPDLVFTLGGRDFALGLEDLTFDRSGGRCLLGLTGHDRQTPMPIWVLGGVFMHKYYVLFDAGQQRLGFALSSAASNATGASKAAN